MFKTEFYSLYCHAKKRNCILKEDSNRFGWSLFHRKSHEVNVMNYIAVGIGGMIGSLLRYGCNVLFSNMLSPFPIGTSFVNLVGCFLLGLFTTIFIERKILPSHISTGIGTGLIGSFTTFSTFSVEIVQLMEDGFLFHAFIYLSVSFFGGLFFAYTGYLIGRKQKVVST